MLYLPLHQPLKKIKAIGIALQSDDPPSSPIPEPQLLSNKQAPIPRDTLDARPHPAFRLQGNDLIHMQPIPIILTFELLVEARANEARIEVGEGGQDASEQLLERERGRRLQRVERGGRGRVGGVEADADYREVFFGRIVRVDEDAADFDVSLGRGVGGIEGVCEVGTKAQRGRLGISGASSSSSSSRESWRV